jgi:dienelactone hydrolase
MVIRSWGPGGLVAVCVFAEACGAGSASNEPGRPDGGPLGLSAGSGAPGSNGSADTGSAPYSPSATNGSTGGGAEDSGGSSATSSSGSSGEASAPSGGMGPAPTSSSASTQGGYMVGSYTSGVPAGQDYVNPTIYYPTDGPAPLPGVVVAPGFTETQSAVNQWGTFLASHGFVVMMVDTASGGVANIGIPPPQRAQSLLEGVETLKAENTRSGSPLAGKIDTSRMAVMGHSMGGGGTLIAANTSPALKAAIGLCPWNPGGTYPTDTVPALVFAGTADPLVPPAMASPEYQSIPATTPKVYAEFTGQSHFFANTPLGTAPTDSVVARIGLSWLEVQEVGDLRYGQFLVKDATMSNFDSKP